MPAGRRPSRSSIPSAGIQNPEKKPVSRAPDPDDDELRDGDDAPLLPPAEIGDDHEGPAAESDETAVMDERDGGLDDAAASDLDIGDLIGDEPNAAPASHEDGLVDDDHDPGTFEEIGADAKADRLDEELPPESVEEWLPGSPDDGGAEGMLDGTEGDVREDDLPALDADAEGELELDEMLRQLGFTGGGGEPWVPASAFGFDRPLAAVACRDGSVAAAGAALVVVGKGEMSLRARSLESPSTACAWIDRRVVYGTALGLHLCEGSGPDLMAIPASGVHAVAVAAGRAWALSERTLLAIDARTGSASAARSDVEQIAATSSTLYVASTGATGTRVLSLRAQDRDWEEIELPGDMLDHFARGASLVVSAAGAVLSVDRSRSILVRPGSNAAVSVPLDDTVAAVFCGDGAGAPVLFATESGALALFDEHHGVVEVGSVPWPPSALAWDATRDLAFVVGPGGLVALGPRVKH